MAAITPITDFNARLLALLLSQYSKSPRILKLVEILASQIQDLEDFYNEICTFLLIDNAEGVWLDLWGAVVGEKRNSLDDTLYRMVIRGRALANRSDGGVEFILGVTDAIIKPVTCRVIQQGRAYFTLQYEVAAFTSQPERDILTRLIGIAKPAGVGCQIVEYETGNFTYDVGPGYDQGPYAAYIGGFDG